MKTIPAGVTILMMVLALSVMPTPSAAGERDCAELLAGECVACHNLFRVCWNLGRKNKKEWQGYIESMAAKGAHLSPAEQKTLASCLAKPARAAKKACKTYAGNTR